MQPAKTFEDLLVWQKSHQFVLEIYKLTNCFPKAETFGITSQLRRAAISIPANIAEGFRKKSKPDKAHYLSIAQGSLEECRYYLILSNDLNYADTCKLKSDLDEVGKMLNAYYKSVEALYVRPTDY